MAIPNLKFSSVFLLKPVIFGTLSTTKQLRLLIKYYFGLGQSAPADVFAPSWWLLTDNCQLPSLAVLYHRDRHGGKGRKCVNVRRDRVQVHTKVGGNHFLSYILRWVNFTNACFTANSITWPTILPIILFSSFSAETWMVFALYNLRHYRF